MGVHLLVASVYVQDVWYNGMWVNHLYGDDDFHWRCVDMYKKSVLESNVHGLKC